MRNNKNTNIDKKTNISETYLNPKEIIGDPIITPSGTVILPVFKVLKGICKGIGEYGEVKVFSPNKSYPKTDAEGGIVSVKPCGFLIEKKGNVKFISVPETYMDKTMDAIIDFIGSKNEKV